MIIMDVCYLDEVISNTFDIEPTVLQSNNKHDRVSMARMAAMLIAREQLHWDDMTISEHYNRSVRMVRHYIKRGFDLIKVDTWFRGKYEYARDLVGMHRLPFNSSHIKEGVSVWTRLDSRNMSYRGVVTDVLDGVFVVESFINPGYKHYYHMDSGRISHQYESSLDIVSIQL